ncbi:MAG: RnfABCDGE type electron transport complex subunit D [Bacillota bacterium]|jgi:electron transport complex protein RnfD
MEQKQLLVTSSPHEHHPLTTQRMMLEVLLALMPAAVLAVFFFKLQALWVMLVGVVSAVVTEAVIQRLTGKPVTVNDFSAAVTGLLLAFTLPPGMPLWMVAVGSVVAIAIAKQVFGGLGDNPFNPALIGRGVLLASFPTQMTNFLAPFTLLTTATPLAGAQASYDALFLGIVPGSLGETSALALLLGGAYLIWRGIIDWRIPAGFIGSVAAFTWIFGGASLFSGNPLFHVLAGGVLLGAFFMATDLVTSPVTRPGRWVMGIGCGLITSIIRIWGGYPEGVTYAILVMNGLTPLIDRYIRPRRFGSVTK